MVVLGEKLHDAGQASSQSEMGFSCGRPGLSSLPEPRSSLRLITNGPRSCLVGTFQSVLTAPQSGGPRWAALACTLGGCRASSSLVKPVGRRSQRKMTVSDETLKERFPIERAHASSPHLRYLTGQKFISPFQVVVGEKLPFLTLGRHPASLRWDSAVGGLGFPAFQSQGHHSV